MLNHPASAGVSFMNSNALESYLLSTAIDYFIIQPTKCQILCVNYWNARAHSSADSYRADILTFCSSRFYSN